MDETVIRFVIIFYIEHSTDPGSVTIEDGKPSDYYVGLIPIIC